MDDDACGGGSRNRGEAIISWRAFPRLHFGGVVGRRPNAGVGGLGSGGAAAIRLASKLGVQVSRTARTARRRSTPPNEKLTGSAPVLVPASIHGL